MIAMTVDGKPEEVRRLQGVCAGGRKHLGLLRMRRSSRHCKRLTYTGARFPGCEGCARSRGAMGAGLFSTQDAERQGAIVAGFTRSFRLGVFEEQDKP